MVRRAFFLRFGYDFFDSKTSTMKRPNGARLNKQIIGETCQLYLPPWWGELLSNVGEEYEINSVKHYSQNKYKEKWIYILEPMGEPRGWFGLFRDGQENKVKSFFHHISPLALDQVRKNKAIICVWHAQEGPATQHLDMNIFEEFHRELDRFKINPNNFVYLTGNLKSKNDYRHMNTCPFHYKHEENINIIEFQAQRHINYPKKYELAKFNRNKKIEKHFLCYNRNLFHPHRLFLLALLQEKKLLSDGLVSFDKIGEYHTKVFHNNLKDWFSFGKKLITEKAKYLEEIKPLSPSIIDVDEWDTNHYDTSPSWPYEQTLFSLVSESHFVQDTLYLSEKIWKAMANNHIFIAVAPFETLKSLRSRGFKTFSPYIDESYDNEKNHYKRLRKIAIEVEKLCKLNDEEIKEFILQTEEIVKYNYDKLVNDYSSINSTFKELKRIIK